MGIIEPMNGVVKAGRAVTIRSAEITDAAALLRHGKDILADNDFAGREADEFTYTLDDETRLIEEHQRDSGKLWLIAEHDGNVIGSIMFSTGATRRTSHRGTLGISVERSWRGQGVGSLLMQRLLEWTEKQATVEKVALAVFATNHTALRLYRKFGFIEEGRRLREFRLGPSEYVDDILMYRWVRDWPAGTRSGILAHRSHD